MRFVALVGNPKPGSRTLTVATAAAEAIALAAGVDEGYEIIDLSVLSRRLLLPEPSMAVEDATELVSRAPYRGLEGTAALPLLVMASPQHALAVDVHLRPLLLELGATVPTPGLAVLESDLSRLDAVLQPWANRVAGLVRDPLALAGLQPERAAALPA